MSESLDSPVWCLRVNIRASHMETHLDLHIEFSHTIPAPLRLNLDSYIQNT